MPRSCIARLLCQSHGLYGGPVRVAKLPTPIAALSDGGEIARSVYAIAVGEGYDLKPWGGNHGEVLCEGIDSEAVPPLKFDLLDTAAEIRNSRLG